MQQLELEKAREAEEKRLEELKKEEYREQVRITMEQNEARRKWEIEQQRLEKEQAMKEQSMKRDHDLMLSKERQNQQRAQKLDTVERIMRANEYKKYQILQKIEQDNERGKTL